ncbi:zinc finger Y-chromosomal protein-like isoform X2 [Amblyomma americanum]
MPATPVSCEACDEQFSTQALLDVHRQREHPQGPPGKHCCTYCPYSSNKKDKDWALRHSWDSACKREPESTNVWHGRGMTRSRCCPQIRCTTRSASLEHIAKHERTHTGERPFVCKVCKKSFVQSSALTCHLAVHVGSKMHECADCGVCFSSLSYLTCHRKRHFGDGELPHVCPQCGKGFFTPKELGRHLLTHTEVRPHACSQCGKTFKASNHARRHERVVHNRRYPVHCPLCGKGMSHLANLRSHVRVRHGSEMPQEKPPDVD